MKVLVIGSLNYGTWIDNYEKCDKMEDTDIVVFTGGEDIYPAYYDEKPHPYTSFNEKRDEIDVHLFEKAIKLNKLIVGICRGSQLATVMAGGKLIQHVNNHAIGETHQIKTHDDVVMDATSTHHQMMYPFNIEKDNYDLLAWSNKHLSDVYFKNGALVYERPEVEPEVVYYNKIKALAIQPHPEYMDRNSEIVIWLNKLIKNYVGI